MPPVNQASTKLHAWGVSDIGKVRSNNQDSGYFDASLVMVADGVGGSAAGDVASATIVQEIAAAMTKQRGQELGPAELARTLTVAVGQANRQLRAIVQTEPSLAGMATTLSGLCPLPGGVLIFHIGDSRIYLLRDRELTQVTRDHSWVQMLLDEGLISVDEAESHPMRNMLLHCLTGSPTDIDALVIHALEVQPGDRFAIVSDGLSSYLPQEFFRRILVDCTQPKAAAELLSKAAVRRSMDNVTVIVADVVDGIADDSPGVLIGAASTLGVPDALTKIS